MNTPERLFDIVVQHGIAHPGAPAFAIKSKGKWTITSYGEYLGQSLRMANALRHSGLRKGERVLLWMVNGPSWNILDTAITMCGGLTVSMFPNASEENISQVVNHALPYCAFVNSPLQMELLGKIFAGKIFLADGGGNYELTFREHDSTTDLAMMGPVMNAVKPGDDATVFYTSGSSGSPKGVVHSHASLMFNARCIQRIYRFDPSERIASLLSTTFIYERIHNYACQLAGSSVWYAGVLNSVAQNLAEIKPGFFVAVPQMLSEIHDAAIHTELAISETEKKEALEYAYGNDPEQSIIKGALPEIPIRFAKLFESWRNVMGGKVRCFSFGAAPMPDELTRFFWNIGVPALMAYGSNEMSLICNNAFPGNVKIGSVGVPIDEAIDVRISSEGEILVKTPAFMKGYYLQGNTTACTTDENGYYHSGDAGAVSDDGFLFIYGRKDNLFKAVNGKFVNPVVVENSLALPGNISHIMAYRGQGGHLHVLFVAPDQKKDVSAAVRRKVEEFNNMLPETPVRAYAVLYGTWSAESGELTPNQKIIRTFVLEKYREILASNEIIIG